MSASTDLTHGDVARILKIIDQLSDVEVSLEVEGMKLHVRKYGSVSGEGARAPAPAALESNAVHASPTPPPIPMTVPLKPPLAASATPPQVHSATADEETQNLVAVRSPTLGRFFRAAAPTEPPFVEVGSRVDVGDTVCVVEVMKLFSTVKAGVRGTVVKILAENGAMVEHDAVLILVKPD